MENHEQHHENMSQPIVKQRYELSDFIPLIASFVSILAFTAIAYYLKPDGHWHYAMRVFMGAFFIVVSVFKLMNLEGFVEAYQTYDIVAMKSEAYARVYPFIELLLGISYFVAMDITVTLWITLVIMLVSAYGVAKTLVAGRRIPCACLGVVFKIPMTWVTLFEDLLMAGMAGVMLIFY